MTLEEAIARCEKIVKEAKKSYEVPVDGIMAEVGMELTKKGIEEYQQYAEWLKELAERRKQPEIIHCGECKHADIYPLGIGRAVSCSCRYGLKDAFVSSYCSYAERKTDADD